CAAPVGIACTFVGFGALIDSVDWPLAFVITGVITAVLALLWTIRSADRPEQHPAVNAAEQQLIEHEEPAWSSEKGAGPPTRGWHVLLRNRSLVLLTISYASVNYIEYLFTFWMHYYFKNNLDMGTIESRYCAGILYVSEAVGMVLGGWLSDRLQK